MYVLCEIRRIFSFRLTSPNPVIRILRFFLKLINPLYSKHLIANQQDHCLPNFKLKILSTIPPYRDLTLCYLKKFRILNERDFSQPLASTFVWQTRDLFVASIRQREIRIQAVDRENRNPMDGEVSL